MIESELMPERRDRQLEFWPDEQREQLRRDLAALQARLDRIPEEREREIEAIRQRYADPTDRTFPVAVEFLVPSDFGKGTPQ